MPQISRSNPVGDICKAVALIQKTTENLLKEQRESHATLGIHCRTCDRPLPSSQRYSALIYDASERSAATSDHPRSTNCQLDSFGLSGRHPDEGYERPKGVEFWARRHSTSRSLTQALTPRPRSTNGGKISTTPIGSFEPARTQLEIFWEVFRGENMRSGPGVQFQTRFIA